MEKNPNRAGTNGTRTQVLPRTPNPPKYKTVQEPERNWTLPVRTKQNPNPNVMVLTRFFHWMKL